MSLQKINNDFPSVQLSRIERRYAKVFNSADDENYLLTVITTVYASYKGEILHISDTLEFNADKAEGLSGQKLDLMEFGVPWA